MSARARTGEEGKFLRGPANGKSEGARKWAPLFWEILKLDRQSTSLDRFFRFRLRASACFSRFFSPGLR